MTGNQRNFAVAGNPISHSLSPVLFGDFAKCTEENYVYSRILTNNVDRIKEIVDAFDIKGINITAPFKQDILKIVDNKSQEVKYLNAANTIVFNKIISAYNTDIAGVTKSLKRYFKKDQKALVLGAGGAAKAVIAGLKQLGIQNIFITNRTKSKAREIADHFIIKFILSEHIEKKHFDIIINTIPVYADEMNRLKITDESILFDANYKNKPFKDLAKKYNARYIDGLEWLKEQGIESYFKMTGVRVDDLNIRKEEVDSIKTRSKKIALTGSMASGKSKIGRILAKKLDFDFVDMDEIIVSAEGKSINDIFEKNGEEYFRKIEKKLLKELVKRDRIVISTGGGVVKDEENINILKENCWNILLYASPEIRSSRINTHKRPLLKGKDVKAIMEKLFSERKNKYFKVSDVIINRNNNDLNKDIELIHEDYSKTFKI